MTDATAGDAKDAGVADATAPAVDASADAASDAFAAVSPRFVAVGYDGRRAMSLDGVTWTNDVHDGSGNVDGPQLFRDVAYANGIFVAVGGGCAGGCKGSPSDLEHGACVRMWMAVDSLHASAAA